MNQPNTAMNQQAYHSRTKQPAWRLYVNSIIAAEISRATRYFERLVFFGDPGDDSGVLYQMVDAPLKSSATTLDAVLEQLNPAHEYSAVLLNGTSNHNHDIEGVLTSLRRKISRSSRVIFVLYNPYLRWFYSFANWFLDRDPRFDQASLTETELANLAKLSGFEVVRVRQAGFVPWRCGGLGTLINRCFAAIPLIRLFSYVWIVFLRPVGHASQSPSLSIVIPARNERGNIEAAITRLPRLPNPIEIIFVEGHSTDGTWEEIQRVSDTYKSTHTIRSIKQLGSGKADAVRLGFSIATGDLLTVLDADLTMPPELLGRFVDAWCNGLADFINGNRLVYPMEGRAMRFLNWLGNIFFAKALSFALDSRLGDSLCGTKLLSRRDYERFARWRGDFGDFDPFGDFELIFPACCLAVGVLDVPVRYRDRVYGSTKIRRFYHGAMLLKMTLVGIFRIRLGPKSQTTQ